MVRESLGDPTRGPIGESLRGDSSTTLVSKVSGPEDRSTLYLEALRDILFNLPTELGNFGRIPCAQRSIYSGVLVGGIVSAISLICTGIKPEVFYKFTLY